MLRKPDKIYVLFFIFLAIFTLIALKGLTKAQPGDENTYYYMGRLISEEKIPYKDFFFAHPPLHAYVLALIYKLFGFNIIILKSIPLMSTLATGFFVFRIAREKFGNAEAVISVLLFLFSYSIMFNSVFSFGIDVATMLLVAGVYFLISKKNYILSGALFGLAATTRLLALVPVSIMLSVLLFSGRQRFFRLSSVFFAVFIIVNGAFFAFLGNDYFSQVYKFHLLKGFGGRENFSEYSDIIKLNWILFLSAFSFIFMKEKKPLNLLVLVSIAYLVFLLALKKIFGFYFVVIFPFLALIGGYSIVRIFRRLNLSVKWKILVSIMLFLVFIWNLASDILFLEKIGFVGFERGKDIVEYINSNSNKDTMLFGDSSVTPLLALLTGKKIALDFVDTNEQVFISGVKDLSGTLARLKNKDVLFVVRSTQGISRFNEVRDFLNDNCGLLSNFHDKMEGDYLVYRCG